MELIYIEAKKGRDDVVVAGVNNNYFSYRSVMREIRFGRETSSLGVCFFVSVLETLAPGQIYYSKMTKDFHFALEIVLYEITIARATIFIIIYQVASDNSFKRCMTILTFFPREFFNLF